jgi:hypothetical protein
MSSWRWLATGGTAMPTCSGFGASPNSPSARSHCSASPAPDLPIRARNDPRVTVVASERRAAIGSGLSPDVGC